MRKQVLHISVHQTSKVIALLYFLLTLIFIIPVGVFMYLYSKDPVFFLFLIYPFIFSILCYISTAIIAWLYNRISHAFGGVEFDLEERPSHKDSSID